MTPQEAIQKLLDRRWTIDQIASASGIHRASVYRILNGDTPAYKSAVSLLDIAKGRQSPPKESAT